MMAGSNGGTACLDVRGRDGVLIVDKPSGMSSGFACRRLQRHFGIRKAGHLGTLDPLATGVLPLCINEGTRLAQFLMRGDKEYVATMRLGIVTDTQDSQGRVLGTSDLPAGSGDEIRDVCARFRGEQLQMPPMFSALKRQGRPLYELARRGETVERRQRPITVYALEVLGVELPDVSLRVHCSSGTYVRTLCHDIGQALGCGAHMSALRRTRSGPFAVDDALALEEALGREAGPVPGRCFVTMRAALGDMPEIVLDADRERKVCNGVQLARPELPGPLLEALEPGARLKLLSRDGALLAVGQRGAEGTVRPLKVFAHG